MCDYNLETRLFGLNTWTIWRLLGGQGVERNQTKSMGKMGMSLCGGEESGHRDEYEIFRVEST